MIVGISGKRGTGKTTAAQWMVKNHKFKQVSFAKDLKDIAKSLFPFTENDLTIPAKKEGLYKGHDWTPRDFLIHLGEFMRFHEPNYWLDRAMTNCKDQVKNNYVFDDVRYKNEAEAIKKLGGVILRIERYPKFNPYGKDLDTPSETEMDDFVFDFTVERMWNIELESLYRQVDAFVDLKCKIKAV